MRASLILGVGAASALAACASSHPATSAAPASSPAAESAAPRAVAPADAGMAGPIPNGRPLLYVADQAPATVTIIDPAGDSVLAVVDLQQLGFSAKAKPHDTAVEPDGSYWYVTLIGDNRILKLDRQNRVVGQAPMETPGLLALDPKSDLLYATRTMSAVNPPERVGLIDRKTMKIEESDVFIPRPHGMAVDPRGNYAYVSSMNATQVATIDGRSGDVTLSPIPGDSMRMIVDFAVSPDGKWVVATDQMYNEALVFDATDPAKLKFVKSIAVEPWPWHAVYSPDGSEVWFPNQKGNAVTVLDTKSWTVKDVVRGNGLAEPHGIAMSPDGKQVFVGSHNQQGAYAPRTQHAGGTGTVVVIDRPTRKIVKVIETDVDPTGMAYQGAP